MSLRNFETSTNRGSPAHLYDFTYGDNLADVLKYTNADQDLGDYKAVAVGHDNVKSKGRGDAVEVKVNIAASSEIAELFKGGRLRRMVYLKIYRGHFASADDPAAWSDTVFDPHWYGRVVEYSRKGATMTITCSTLGAGMAKPALGYFYQRSCQHALYGTRCGADKSAATQSGIVITNTGVNSLTLTDGWKSTYTKSKFIGGMVEWDGPYGREYRTIMSVSGNTVNLDAHTDNLAVSDTVDVILGCPHTKAGCISLHDNILNYGGMPFIPLLNPINKNNHT
jgi:hypothetical protein